MPPSTEPILTLVVLPAAAPVPTFTALVLPEAVGSVAKLVVTEVVSVEPVPEKYPVDATYSPTMSRLEIVPAAFPSLSGEKDSCPSV